MGRAGLVGELEVLAEHAEQVLFQPITSGWTQVSKSTLAPSKPICGE
jgi:hypothetical protein